MTVAKDVLKSVFCLFVAFIVGLWSELSDSSERERNVCKQGKVCV